MEIWKDISGFEGLYQVSDCGQVKSCERVVKHWRGGNQILKERILKPSLHTGGYLKIELSKDGKRETFLVHRIVALAFLEGNNSLTVNHIDECKTNNHVSNLEYLTRGENAVAWMKNNPERRAEHVKNSIYKAINKISRKVFDTKTSKTFPSMLAASRYMYEEESAKGPYVWENKIRSGKQNRFQIINN